MKNQILLFLILTMTFSVMATPVNYETSYPIDHGSAVDQLVQVTPQSATLDLGNYNDFGLDFCGDQNDRHIGNSPSIGHRIYQSSNFQIESDADSTPFQPCEIDRAKNRQHFISGMRHGFVDQYYKTATKNDHQIAHDNQSKRTDAYRQREVHTYYFKATYMDWWTGSGSVSWRHSNSTLKTKMALI